MDAVTYPDPRILEFVNARLIPLRILSDDKLAAEFKVKWTPTLITLDEKGQEHHRSVGFLKPEEFEAVFLLGIGKTHFENGDFEAAIRNFREVTQRFPNSKSAPESVYLTGVALYKHTGKASHLREAYEELTKSYPGSDWADRADPYKLIP